jgi:tetratricopeptide (TPR) repeat protein
LNFADESREGLAQIVALRGPGASSVEELLAGAAELEEAGQWKLAANVYRAALATGGARADICFLLAEVFYRLGEHGAARERYFMAIELDEDFVEARANLGCLLAELGEFELALAALAGALANHPDYADAHYHLARLLDEAGRCEEAREHWQRFLELAPESPWSEEAAARIGEVRSEK